MIGKTIFAIANEESTLHPQRRAHGAKARVDHHGGHDGHRLAHVERPGEKFEGISGEMKTLVPKKP